MGLKRPLNILIVGAGIGGLSAAIALAQIGAKVDVIEIKSDNNVPGVGFGLRANGLRAIQEIGLLNQCLSIGHKATNVSYFDWRGRHLFDMNYGTEPEGLPASLVMARLGYLEIALQRALDLGCDIRMATTVQALRQDGDRVLVDFSSGGSGEYDLVIGFDGVNSQIRHEYFGAQFDPVPAGGVAWRTALPRPDGVTGTVLVQGMGGKIVLAPLPNDQMYMVLTVAESGRPRYDPAEMPAIMHQRARALMMNSDFLAPSIDAILQSKSVAYTPYATTWVPYPWFRGRVMIMGDATHAMTPYLGSGAAMSIEDGVVLAQTLDRSETLQDAQIAFMARRLPRVRAVRDRSIEAMLEEFDSMTPEALERRISFLVEYEAIADEYANQLLAMDY